METNYNQLKTRLIEVNDIQAAAGLLHWDQSTYMPPGGAAARARQSATLRRLAHEKFTDPTIGKLLDDLIPYEQSLDYSSDEASLLRLTRRQYERAIKIPSDFLAEVATHTSESYQVWTEARPANDFERVRPYLEKTLEYSRQSANFFPGYDHIADPLIEPRDYGMKAADVKKVFAELREQLVPIASSITSQPPADDTCLHKMYPEEKQLSFGLDIATKFGYDLNRGRSDKTHHPFMTKFSLGDVRITTRSKEDSLGEAMFCTMHETGHALYEQGIRMDFEGTPLARGTSAGVHESQSRLWENIVGRSKGFWKCFYPQLQQLFPDQLNDVSLDTFHRAINKVERSLIRTEADEVTYNLHVMLRFDFELALLEGEMEIKNLPNAWRERFEADFGIAPPDDKDGVLQDVHWYYNLIGGGFQGYTLGNILGAQFYATALETHPNIPNEIENGEFQTLHNWLIDNVYQHGSKFTAPEIIERATGKSMTIEPYMKYLRTKYGELYSLDSLVED